MTERILHLEHDAYPEDALARWAELGVVVPATAGTVDELVAIARTVDPTILVVTVGVAIDARIFDAAPRLRCVVSPTTGLDHVDVGVAQERGIAVISLRDAMHAIEQVSATAEMTWALLLALVRRVPGATASVLGGTWQRELFRGDELRGRTLAVAGYGRLGRKVARYGLAFEMEVVVHDTDPAAVVDLPPGVRALGADDLVRAADVLSLHLPLTASTEGWLDRRRIGLLRPGALVVNTARGELVDEAALADAVRDGRVAGVAADVLHGDGRWEGRTGESPLLAAARDGHDVVVTPHIGGLATAAIHHTRRVVTDLCVAGHRRFP